MTDNPERLEDLLRRYSEPDAEPPAVHRVSLDEAIAGAGDPLHVLQYLAGLGIPVRSLDDLLKINGDPDEEEIHSFQVEEGIAVSIASQGEWILFTP